MRFLSSSPFIQVSSVGYRTRKFLYVEMPCFYFRYILYINLILHYSLASKLVVIVIYKTRSTRDGSVTHSLQTLVWSKSSISHSCCFLFLFNIVPEFFDMWKYHIFTFDVHIIRSIYRTGVAFHPLESQVSSVG